MSVESAKAFLERMKTDEDFHKRVGEVENAAERLAFVKAEGYDFTREEIGSVATELSEEELDKVAGGWNPGGCGMSEPCNADCGFAEVCSVVSTG